MTTEAARKITKDYYGFNPTPILEGKQVLIGWGHLVNDGAIRTITREEADKLFVSDYQEAVFGLLGVLRQRRRKHLHEDLRKQFFIRKDLDTRWVGMIDVVFEVGAHSLLRDFPGFFDHLRDANWGLAANALLWSDPETHEPTGYRRQSGTRAVDNSHRLRCAGGDSDGWVHWSEKHPDGAPYRADDGRPHA